MSEQHERTRHEFARQAPAFERPGSIFTAEDILEWICRHVPVGASDAVLDVAGGTGALGRRLAERAAFALIVDLTPEMLAAGAGAARRAGCENVVFLEGDAAELPFAEEQFDLVVTRFAFHHLPHPGRAAGEMRRVCKPGGRVVVIDMVSEPGAGGDRHNELERMRDPSHARALQEQELIEALADAGIAAETVGERTQRMSAVPWLDQAKPAQELRASVLAALQAEIEDGAPTGLHAALENEQQLSIEQRWLIVAGPRA